MATGPIETHLHRSLNWENGAPGARMGPRGRSASCGNGLSAQCVRLRSEINHCMAKPFAVGVTVMSPCSIVHANAPPASLTASTQVSDGCP